MVSGFLPPIRTMVGKAQLYFRLRKNFANVWESMTFNQTEKYKIERGISGLMVSTCKVLLQWHQLIDWISWIVGWLGRFFHFVFSLLELIFVTLIYTYRKVCHSWKCLKFVTDVSNLGWTNHGIYNGGCSSSPEPLYKHVFKKNDYFLSQKTSLKLCY